MAEPKVHSCLWPAIYLEFVKKTGWRSGSPTIPPAQAEHIHEHDHLVCEAPESIRGQWLAVTAISGSSIELADQDYKISAIISEEGLQRVKSLCSACSSSSSPGLCLLIQLLKCGIGLSLNPSTEKNEHKFFLYVLDFDDCQVRRSQPWDRPWITNQSNVKTLIQQAREWMISAPSSSSALAPIVGAVHAASNDTAVGNYKPREKTDFQTSMVSAQLPTEQQRWEKYRKLGRIPKYGSCPSTTSQAQVVLLGQAQAWDPAPPGQDGPRGYIPLGDLELLTKLHEHPDTFVEDPRDTLVINKSRRNSPLEKQNVQSFPDDPVAYAQVVRRRDTTPDATALGQSQWPLSPSQRKKPNSDESVTYGSPKSHRSAGLQPCTDNDKDVEMNSDLEEPASSQLPADTDSDSDLEEIAPKSMSDVPSSVPSNEIQTPRTSTIQVGRTPYSGTERLEALKKKPEPRGTSSENSAPSKLTMAGHATRNVAILKGSTVFNNKNAQQNGENSSPSRQLPTESSQAEEPGEVRQKRKATSEHQLDRKAKTYRVKTNSPIFSQDLQDHVDSASTIDRLRYEHFKQPPQTVSAVPPPQASVVTQNDSPALSRQVPREIMHLSEDSSSEIDEDVQKTPVQRVQRGGASLHSSTSQLPSLHNRQPAPATRTQIFGDADGSMQGHVGSSLKMHSQSTSGIHGSQHVREIDVGMPGLAQQPKRKWHEIIGAVGPRGDDQVDNQMSESSDESGPHRGLPTSQFSIRTEDLGEAHRAPVPTSGHPLHRASVTTSSGGLYERFKYAYPTYMGSFKQFLAICRKIHNPKEGSSLMKAFLDDFVGRFPLEYKPYFMLSLDEGESPQSYEEWFEDNVEATKFKKKVLSKDNIAVFLSGGDSNISRDVTSTTSMTPIPLSRIDTRERSVSPPIARSHQSVRSSHVHTSRSFNPQHDMEAALEKSSASHTARPANDDKTIDLTGDGADVEGNSQAKLAKDRGRLRRSLPWPLPSNTTMLDESRTLENILPRRESNHQAAHSAPRLAARLNTAVVSRTMSSPNDQDRATANSTHKVKASLQANRMTLGRVASTEVLPPKNRPIETNPRAQAVQSKHTDRSRLDLTKKPMTAAIAEYKPPGDYRADEHSPMRVFNRNIQGIKPSAGNAFAQEAAIKPVTRTSFKNTKVNMNNFVPRS